MFRKSVNPFPVCRENDHLVALVTDSDINVGVPKFEFDDIKSLADFIEKEYL